MRRNAAFCIAWMSENAYNDFAVVRNDVKWIPKDKIGELFRIEAKSMFVEADEPKGHFDRTASEIGDREQLLVIVWKWSAPNHRGLRHPVITDQYLGRAKPIAEYRNLLHQLRGGWFIGDKGTRDEHCPDKCTSKPCGHFGEAINAHGVRERRSGPNARKGTGSASYANNFGGLVRMLAISGAENKERARRYLLENPVAMEFVEFMYRTLPNKAQGHFTIGEIQKAA